VANLPGAERRIGEISLSLEKATPRPKIDSSKNAELIGHGKLATLADAGITQQHASRCEKLARKSVICRRFYAFKASDSTTSASMARIEFG
jgi:hypothetical protein